MPKILHFTRKTTSPTKRVSILTSAIVAIKETKDSTTIELHQAGFDLIVIVTEDYLDVLFNWQDSLNNDVA